MAHLGLGLATSNSKPSAAVGRGRGRSSRQARKPQGNPVDRLAAVVIAAIEEKPEMFLEASGKLAIKAGDKAVTLRFGDSKTPMTREAEADADLTLTAHAETLWRILTGKVDAVAELSSGALLLEGNIELLPPLFLLLERGQSMLALRSGR